MATDLTSSFAKYPHTRRIGPLVFLAGQGCRDPKSNQCAGITRHADQSVAGYDIVAQTRGVLKNIERALASEGLSKENLVDVTVFLKSMDDFEAMNAVWNEWVSDPAPTRTTVAVKDLPGDNFIEMKAIAHIPE